MLLYLSLSLSASNAQACCQRLQSLRFAGAHLGATLSVLCRAAAGGSASCALVQEAHQQGLLLQTDAQLSGQRADHQQRRQVEHASQAHTACISSQSAGEVHRYFCGCIAVAKRVPGQVGAGH